MPGSLQTTGHFKTINKMDANITIFIELMDSLFWEGYTKQLSADNPERFNFEYKEFLNNYN